MSGLRDELEQAVLGGRDLTARPLFEVRASDQRAAVALDDFRLRQAHAGKLRDRVDPCRRRLARDSDLGAECVAHRAPTLVHGGRGQGGRADHVTYGIDVRRRGSPVFVDRYQAARCESNPCGLDGQALHLSDAAERAEELFALHQPARRRAWFLPAKVRPRRH